MENDAGIEPVSAETTEPVAHVIRKEKVSRDTIYTSGTPSQKIIPLNLVQMDSIVKKKEPWKNGQIRRIHKVIEYIQFSCKIRPWQLTVVWE